MKILVLNCGSSSLKYQLINMENEEVMASGKYERIGEKEAFITHKVNGKKIELNVSLHGCSIIFSDKYVSKYKYPFYNETFLFHEEEFLYNRVIKDSLISMYDPNLKVFHKEGSSINKKNKTKRLSKLFRESERLKSLELLLKEM